MTDTKAAPGLYDDQRGAVMLTGLLMSCFLIGSLWFIIGIGDTLVFRDKMQEAADHAAFTAAAMNAKGMNFIALCNLIMVAGTVVHIILGIVSDIAGVVYGICLAACLASCLVGCEACECVDPTWEAWQGAFRIWDGYFKVMKTAFKGLHTLEQVASYAYPAGGSVEAFEVGMKYEGDKRHGKVNVIALSASMVPTQLLAKVVDKVDPKAKPGDPSSTKEGLLPVQPKKYEDLCKKVVSLATSGVVNLVGAGKSLGGGAGGAVLKGLNNILGSGLQWRYCNKSGPIVDYSPDFWLPPPPLTGSGGGMDSFWGENGFYVVYNPAGNGTVYFQSWAMNVAPQLYDNSESKVAIAAKKPSLATKYMKTEQPIGYFTQSEMYFDCDSDWNAVACNFEDNALFAIKWRARLRKLDFPAVTSGVVGAALAALGDSAGAAALKSKVAGAIGGKLAGLLGTSGLGQSALEKGIEGLLDQGVNILQNLGGNLAGNFDPKLQGVYH